MRLLVTRPSPSHEGTLQRLHAQGHEAWHLPVMALTPLEHGVVTVDLDAVIASSAHVFQFLNYDAVLGQVHLPLACVGERTADAARDFGFRNIACIAEDANTLTEMIPEHFPKETRFLYPCARERSTDFAHLGVTYPVTLYPIYGADALHVIPDTLLEQLKANEIDGVLHYSKRSAELFIALSERYALQEGIKNIRHFCLAEKVAKPLVAAGATQIIISPFPNEKALMETISAL